MGYSKKKELSSAERQAVYFHFIKYELTNHILEQLKPKSVNFTCKDAIDRGGVSSAYYNLIKSFEPRTQEEVESGVEKIPMSREEFEQALHAAPTMVKGRGMNHHLNVIWNAVDAYVSNEANYNRLMDDPKKTWLLEWRDLNCPHDRVAELLERRITECKNELEKEFSVASEKQRDVLIKANQVLEEVEKQRSLGVSRKRLLLETVTRTTSLAINPDQPHDKKEKYEALRKKLSINHPELQVLGGLMKAFVGAIVFVLSLGTKSKMVESGLATFKAASELSSRVDLQTKMKEQLKAMPKGDVMEAESEKEEEANQKQLDANTGTITF